MSEELEKRPIAQPFAIKLYPDERDRFKQIKDEMDNVRTDRDAFNALMEYYENPQTIVKDNPELVQRVSDMENDIKTKDAEIADLKTRLQEAQDVSNSNASAGNQLQLEIDHLKAENADLKKALDHSPYYVGGEMPAVPMRYLRKMAKMQSELDKKERSPFWILKNNFIKDLQDPRSNHLPMIVSSEELRKAEAEYKKSLETPKKEE